MLVSAGLEYLSWVSHVVEGARSRDEQRARPAQANLRELLIEARIPQAVPAELDALERLRVERELPDAPAAIAWLRNRLVHPKDANEPYQLERLVLQSWQLLMQYAELLLLHDLDY